MASSDLFRDIREAFSALSERGLLGGVFAGILGFTPVLAVAQSTPVQNLGWIFAVCVVLGMILSPITYEFLMPAISASTKWFVSRGFRSVTGQSYSYHQVREFRERFLATSQNEYLKNQILKDQRLRQATTYYLTATMLGFGLWMLARYRFRVDDAWMVVEQVVLMYVLTATIVGEISRSVTLGRSIGFAFKNSQPPP